MNAVLLIRLLTDAADASVPVLTGGVVWHTEYDTSTLLGPRESCLQYTTDTTDTSSPAT